jgi:hypothetical protein
MRVSFWIITSFVLVLGHWSGATASSNLNQTKSQKDTRVIDSLPVPNDEEIRKIRTTDKWHNPFVMVHRDGYELILREQPRSQRLLSLKELEQTLLKIPLERWPLGKVVAVQEIGLRIPGDDTKIAFNLKALKRMLGSHKIRVDRWPTA